MPLGRRSPTRGMGRSRARSPKLGPEWLLARPRNGAAGAASLKAARNTASRLARTGLYSFLKKKQSTAAPGCRPMGFVANGLTSELEPKWLRTCCLLVCLLSCCFVVLASYGWSGAARTSFSTAVCHFQSGIQGRHSCQVVGPVNFAKRALWVTRVLVDRCHFFKISRLLLCLLWTEVAAYTNCLCTCQNTHTQTCLAALPYFESNLRSAIAAAANLALLLC